VGDGQQTLTISQAAVACCCILAANGPLLSLHPLTSLACCLTVSPSFSPPSPGKDRSAFTDKAAGKLALPRLLRLKPEDKLATGGKPLKSGRFTWVTEAGTQERWIVASCGRHTVIWNFRRYGLLVFLYERGFSCECGFHASVPCGVVRLCSAAYVRSCATMQLLTAARRYSPNSSSRQQ
jgi:hypothetical protein